MPECWTLEDAEQRAPASRPAAIPPGLYGLRLAEGGPGLPPRVPELVNVPGFARVRILPGNTIDDTPGCILLGRDRGRAAILRNRTAFPALMEKLETVHAAGAFLRLRILTGLPDGPHEA